MKLQRLFRRQRRPPPPPRIEESHFPEPEVTFGEENPEELVVANQTFVSAHLVGGESKAPDQTHADQGPIHHSVSPSSSNHSRSSVEEPAIPRSSTSLSSTRSTNRHRSGLQEDDDEDDRSSIPPMGRRTPDRGSSREHLQRTIPRSIPTPVRPATWEGHDLPAPPSDTEGNNRRRMERLSTLVEEPQEQEQSPQNSETQEPRRKFRWRRRRRQRETESQQPTMDCWKALEMHPRLQQALLDVYWQRRERDMVERASRPRPDDDYTGLDPRIAHFLLQQDVALDSLHELTNDSTTSTNSMNPQASQEPSTPTSMSGGGGPSSASVHAVVSVESEQTPASMGVPSLPQVEEVSVGSKKAAVGQPIDSSDSIATNHIPRLIQESDNALAEALSVHKTAHNVPPQVNVTGTHPGHEESWAPPRRKLSDVTLQWELQLSQSDMHSISTRSNEALPVHPRQIEREDAEGPSDEEHYYAKESKEEYVEELIEDEYIEEVVSDGEYEEEIVYESCSDSEENRFVEEDYMNDEQLQVYMNQLSLAQANKDSYLDNLMQQSLGKNPVSKVQSQEGSRLVVEPLQRSAPPPSSEDSQSQPASDAAVPPQASLDASSGNTSFGSSIWDDVLAAEDGEPLTTNPEKKQRVSELLQAQEQAMKEITEQQAKRTSRRSIGLQDDDSQQPTALLSQTSSTVAAAAMTSPNAPRKTMSMHSVPSVASTSAKSSFGIRTDFACACCFESKATREEGFACDNLQAPHMLCSDCLRRYMSTAHETGAPVEYIKATGPSPAMCRIPCFGHSMCGHVIHIPLERLYEDSRPAPATVLKGFYENNAYSTTSSLSSYSPRKQVVPKSDSDSSEAEAPEQRINKAMDQVQRAMKEALSNVHIRSCPQCRSAFVKNDDGCNKMTCPTCKTTSCYCCRQVVPKRGYDHFDNRPLTLTEKYAREQTEPDRCPLWTNENIDQERDREAMRQVLFEMANQVWEECLRVDPVERDGECDNDVFRCWPADTISQTSLDSSIADLIAKLPSEDANTERRVSL